ncbi:MAG: precorrin-3B C(17)-methyltransferase [Desulfovibrio sp.]|nr:precorrin-3B C(17)-methyltransferase [Desulfovibrio sp.]
MSAATLHVLGLGPGSAQCLTPQARAVLSQADCVVGYQRYMELVPEELLTGKRCLSSGMRQERARCEAAVDMALSGLPTALVCSGDPGIYALAGLTLETLEARALTDTVPLSIVPGVPAVCAAAALLGAPLSHDFACVSLSDLLTPWELIVRRVTAAMTADFVCVLYNPRSRGRPDHLRQILELIRAWRAPHCPVGLVRQAFRAGQEVSVCRLDAFDATRVDMLSICIVGNTQSRTLGRWMLTPRGYERFGKNSVRAATGMTSFPA